MQSTILRIWNSLERHPWWTMVVAVFAQTWFCLNNRALWFSDEVRYGNAYQNLVHAGKWMVLSLNGQPYPDKPPVYFWFLWLLDTITPADMPTVFFLGSALSGLMLLGASYALARTLGFNRTVSLAGVLVLLSNFLLVGLFHYSRMDLMFAALIILSHACFFKAFSRERQGWWPVAAFVLAGVATLVKGPLGFIFPLLSFAIYLGWKGELKRFATRQMALGLLAMIAILAAWVAGVVMVEGEHFLVDVVLGKHVIQRATKTFHHREPLQYYFIAFPLAWLPWTLFVFVSPVRRLFRKAQWSIWLSTRREAGPRALLWIMFVSTFVFLSSLSGKVLIYILPMFPPLAILTADAMVNMDSGRMARYWKIAAGLWIVFGVGLIVAGDLLPFPVPIRGMGICALLLLAGGAGLYQLRDQGFRGGLLGSVLALTLWLYPLGLMVAPSLDNGMSTKRQGEIIGSFVDKGYTPMSFKVYSGVFTYYAGHDFEETGSWEEITPMVEGAEKVVLSIRQRHFDEWKDKPEGLVIVDHQNIAGMDYLIVIKD